MNVDGNGPASGVLPLADGADPPPNAAERHILPGHGRTALR